MFSTSQTKLNIKVSSVKTLTEIFLSGPFLSFVKEAINPCQKKDMTRISEHKHRNKGK